jgi:hypothetical protein
VYTVATLNVDMSGVPQHLYKTGTSPSGARYQILSFDVKIAVQSALEFSMSVNGVEYGSVTAKYA